MTMTDRGSIVGNAAGLVCCRAVSRIVAAVPIPIPRTRKIAAPRAAATFAEAGADGKNRRLKFQPCLNEVRPNLT
jgi:hypothetical protein